MFKKNAARILEYLLGRLKGGRRIIQLNILLLRKTIYLYHEMECLDYIDEIN